MLKLTLFATLALLTNACNAASTPSEDDRYNVTLQGEVRYVQDPRTNLCFAYSNRRWIPEHALALTPVPCDAVKAVAVPLKP